MARTVPPMEPGAGNDGRYHRIADHVAAGRLGDALTDLRRIVDDPTSTPLDVGRSRRLASTIIRTLDPELAVRIVETAIDEAPPELDTELRLQRVLALRADNRPADAADALDALLGESEVGAEDRVALLRLRAELALEVGAPDQATALLVDACAHVADGTEMADLLLLAASCAHQADDHRRTSRLLDRAAAVEGSGARPDFTAELELVRVADAFARSSVDDALVHARRARKAALAAVSPMHYLASSLAEARIFEARDDRPTTYAVLARTVGTLADAVGEIEALDAVEPEFDRLRERWGVDDFARIKADYEDRRRTELGRLN